MITILTISVVAVCMAVLSLASPVLEKWRNSNYRISVRKKDLTYYRGIKQTQLTTEEYILKKGL